MAENSKIEWTDHTFNPWRGCTAVSPACEHCYAEALSKRNPKALGVWGPNGTRVVVSEEQWWLPIKWNQEAEAAGERRRVFCASLADVFENWQGPMVDSQGRTLYRPDCEPGNAPVHWIQTKLRLGRGLLSMADVRRRLLSLIAKTPKLVMYRVPVVKP